jgi:cathepsin D
MAVQTESESERRQKYKGNHACASTVMAMDISREQFLVGDIFMRRYYTVFDRDNDRVGLAEANTNDKLKALTQKK